MDSVKNMNAGVLAYVGDAYYELLVRTLLAGCGKPPGELNREALNFVSAPAQARAFALIESELTEGEMSVFRRGRNFKTNNTPKNASQGEYHTATGFECLFGYLYLSGNEQRARELFGIITENI